MRWTNIVGMIMGTVLYYRASRKVKFNHIDGALFIIAVTLLFI